MSCISTALVPHCPPSVPENPAAGTKTRSCAISLRACYAMSGTDIACCASSLPVNFSRLNHAPGSTTRYSSVPDIA
eukprot:10767-Rhodomonas_salina.1